MKAKNQEVLSPVPLAVGKVKGKDLQDTEEKCPDKAAPVLSAEEATDRFLAELKQDISMRKTLGIYTHHTDSVKMFVPKISALKIL